MAFLERQLQSSTLSGTASAGAHHAETGALFFACRLRRLLSISALGAKDEPPYHESFRRRQTELLTALSNRGDEGRTYEFRIISRPDALVPARGQVEIYVLCRSEIGALREIEAYTKEFLRMLSSSFPEYEFEQVPNSDLPQLLNPFQTAQSCGIRRRVGIEQLDTLRPSKDNERRQRRTSSEAEEAAVLGPTPEGSLLHIYPFLPTRAPFDNLFRLLLLEPHPYVVSVRFRPTRISAPEMIFLEHSIAVCERHSQVTLGRIEFDHLSGLFPTLRDKARAHEEHLSRLLFGLRDNAALLSITIMSPAGISPFMPEAMGAVITEPAGGTEVKPNSGISPYLAGGYDVFPVDAAVAADAMGSLDLIVPNQESVPASAQRLPYLFDSAEAATSILLPPISAEPLSGVDIRGWRRALAPRKLADVGVLLGETVEPGLPRAVRITPDDRLRHVYTVGQTGTGKSTLLKTMILDDITSGSGVCILDPHGDLYKDLLGRIPESRLKDVILIDPTDVDFPVGLNLLEVRDESQRHFVVQELTSILTRMLRDNFGDTVFQMTGPMFFQHMRMNLLLVMSDPEQPGTLMDFYMIFQERDYWKKWTPLKMSDPMLENWVENVLPNMDYTKQTSDGPQWGAYINSKFESFLFDPMLRSIFAQSKSTVDFGAAMDTGKIVLVNLAKGELSEANSAFLGMVVLAMVQAAAMRRSRTPHSSRRPFYVYVDEFQSIATENFVTLLSEGRKFGIGLTLANQFVSQIHNEKIMDSIFGNVGTMVCFRLGDTDAERIEKEMAPTISRSDLLDIPNWHAYVSTLINNQTVRPFEMCTLVDETSFDADRAVAVRDASRDAVGTPSFVDRAWDVESEVTLSHPRQDPSGRVKISPRALDIPGLGTRLRRAHDEHEDRVFFQELLTVIPANRRINLPRLLTVEAVDDFISKLIPLQKEGQDILCTFEAGGMSYAAAITLFNGLLKGPSRIIAWVPTEDDPFATLALQACTIRIGGALAKLSIPHDFSYEAKSWVFADSNEDRYIKRRRTEFREHQVLAKEDRATAVKILLRRTDKTRAEVMELISEPQTIDGADAVTWGFLDVVLGEGESLDHLAASSEIVEPVTN